MTSPSQTSSRPPTWRYIVALARYRLPVYLASGILASIMYYLFPLIPGLIVRRIFDLLESQAAGQAFSEPVVRLVLLLVAVAVARVISLVSAGMAETMVHLFVNSLLQRNMLAHVLRQPGARSLPYSPGEAVARFRDDVEQIPAFLSWTIDPVGQAIGIGVGIVVLWQVDPRITLAIFLPLALVVIVINQATRRIRIYREAAQQSIGHVTGLVGEIFGAVTGVKVANAEKNVVRHLEQLNEERRSAVLRDTLFSQFLNTISYNMGNLGTGVLLVAAAAAMSRGDFSVGDFALFVSYISWLTTITGMFGNYLAKYRQVGVSLDRLLAIMKGTPSMKLVEHNPVYLTTDPPPVELPPASGAGRLESLEVRGLRYTYPDTQRGIQNLDLNLAAGSLTVITGRVGAGKTTALRALLGLLPAEGQVYWNGKRVSDPAAFLTPPRAAYTPQVPRLFSESLRDNILMGLPVKTDAAVNAVDQAIFASVMEDDIAGLDNGLETLVGPRGVKLSGGQRQRAAAARMFVRAPDLLVFDDLSSALDVNTERMLWERLFSSPNPPAILAVSHRRAVLRRADRVILLKDSKVEGVGTVDELLAASEEMQKLWEGDAR